MRQCPTSNGTNIKDHHISLEYIVIVLLYYLILIKRAKTLGHYNILMLF